jgi:hypothetical protein
MMLLQNLRNTPWLARLALLWFALTLGVAVASPMLNPQQELTICSAAGTVKLKISDDGSLNASASAEAFCPLCVMSGAPSDFVGTTFEAVQPLGRVLQSIPASHIAAHTAAPPPSRGPPKQQ